MPPKPIKESHAVDTSKTKPKGEFEVNLLYAFIYFSHVNVLFSLYSPIQDCDEVFNFWEPTHYLNHGNGLQTWEYSPEYAIRSWLYISLHAIPAYFMNLLPIATSRTYQFHFLRVALGLVTAACEARLFMSLYRSMSPRIAFFFFMSLVSTAGMFHATGAYLPSSFAMCTTMLAVASFADWRGGSKTVWGLLWLGIGTIVGWPFVGILALPFVLEELAMGMVGGDLYGTFQKLFIGVFRCLIVLGNEMTVDSFFYNEQTSVPLNIVRYNIFSSSDKGPDIFGTEPWYFYLNNLLINFNIWFILAQASLPLLLFQNYYRRKPASNFTFFRTVIFLSPYYLWLAIFTLQPHKEERFMYPIYPCLALNAAISLQIIYLNLVDIDSKTVLGKLPSRLRLMLFAFVPLLAITVGIWRIMSLATAYTAPIHIYRTLFHEPALIAPSALASKQPVANVCIGKEWYRFPSHYNLPASTRLKFVRSDFRGLLPGEFSGGRTGLGIFPDTWITPPGMNDMNIEDPGKYTSISLCDYMVDSYFPLDTSPRSPLEPDYVLDTETWERMECLPFLDAARTPLLARLFWIPDFLNDRVPQQMHRSWGEYCLLRRRKTTKNG